MNWAKVAINKLANRKGTKDKHDTTQGLVFGALNMKRTIPHLTSLKMEISPAQELGLN